MAVSINSVGSSGLTLVATAQMRSTGQWWDENASQYQASEPTFADKSISLAESSGDYLGHYSGSPSGSLGTGLVDLFIHDTVASRVIGHQEIQVVAGENSGFTPIDQQPVPLSRTVQMIRGTTGLVGQETLALSNGEEHLIALDFDKDMPQNGRISIAVATESGGPLLGSTITEGQDGSQVKLRFTPTATGDATLGVVVTYANGGGQAEGTITIKVV